MSPISRLDRSQLTPEMVAHYDKAISLRGNVPNMFRVMEPARTGEGGCAA
jgi:hypothetical protein